MTSPFKGGRKPDPGHRAGSCRIGFPSRKDQDIGIVMLSAHSRRQHNDANILVLPGRKTDPATARPMSGCGSRPLLKGDVIKNV